MNINRKISVNNTNQTRKYTNKVFTGKYKLKKALRKDVFEKSKQVVKSQFSKQKENIKYPNTISTKFDDFSGDIGHKLKFYPEDIEKMKTMSLDEKISYMKFLIENKKFSDIVQK